MTTTLLKIKNKGEMHGYRHYFGIYISLKMPYACKFSYNKKSTTKTIGLRFYLLFTNPLYMPPHISAMPSEHSLFPARLGNLISDSESDTIKNRMNNREI